MSLLQNQPQPTMKEIESTREARSAVVKELAADINACVISLEGALRAAHARGFVLGREHELRRAPPPNTPDLLTTLTWIRDNCTGLPAVARALADQAIKKAQP